MDDRPQRAELPEPPAISLTPPPMDPASFPRAPALPAALAPVEPSEPPAPPEPDPEDEPLAGPARLFVGGPRAVEPTGVRASGTNAMSVHGEEGEARRAPRADASRRPDWTGLDRSARTVAEDRESRIEREQRERDRERRAAAARERTAPRPAAPRAWDALAQGANPAHGAYPRWEEPAEPAAPAPDPADPLTGVPESGFTAPLEPEAPPVASPLDVPASGAASARADRPRDRRDARRSPAAASPADPPPAEGVADPLAAVEAAARRAESRRAELQSDAVAVEALRAAGLPPRSPAQARAARAALGAALPPRPPPLAQAASAPEEDAFFEAPVPAPFDPPEATRPPERRLQPGFAEGEGPRPASARFVPRNQRPAVPERRATAPIWWFAVGLFLLGAGLVGLAWRIRKDVAEPTPAAPPASAEAPPSPETLADAEANLAAPVPTGSAVAATPDPLPVEASPAPAADPVPVAEPVAPVPVPLAKPPPPAPPPAAAEKADPPAVEQGVLYVLTDEPARVTVDGKRLGTVKASGSFPLDAGVHDVRLVSVRSGRTQSLEVRIDAGRSSQIGFRLK